MDVKTLKNDLCDALFVTDALEFRKTKHMIFPNEKEAKDFFVKYLTLEAISGYRFKDYELVDTFNRIQDILHIQKNMLLSNQLPFYFQKSQPKKIVQYVLNGCECAITNDVASKKPAN